MSRTAVIDAERRSASIIASSPKNWRAPISTKVTSPSWTPGSAPHGAGSVAEFRHVRLGQSGRRDRLEYPHLGMLVTPRLSGEFSVHWYWGPEYGRADFFLAE